MAGQRPLAAQRGDHGPIPEDLNQGGDQPLCPPEGIGQIVHHSPQCGPRPAQLQLNLAGPRAAPARWAADRQGLL